MSGICMPKSSTVNFSAGFLKSNNENVGYVHMTGAVCRILPRFSAQISPILMGLTRGTVSRSRIDMTIL